MGLGRHDIRTAMDTYARANVHCDAGRVFVPSPMPDFARRTGHVGLRRVSAAYFGCSVGRPASFQPVMPPSM